MTNSLESTILHHSEATDFILDSPDLINQWIERVVLLEHSSINLLNFIFCNDEYLHSINTEYLNHDTYTDIITFPYSEGNVIEGDIFISVDRIKENAVKFNTDFRQELRRVIIHGVLHLLGYKDKTESDKNQMTKKEDTYLDLWLSLS